MSFPLKPKPDLSRAPRLESDPEIVRIVDRVAADMRPKVVEEMARRLGEKENKSKRFSELQAGKAYP